MAIIAVATCATATMAGSCRGRGEAHPRSASLTVLRVGVAQLSATNPTAGLRQLSQNQAVENLMRVGEDGRFQPWLAESLAVAPNGRSLTVKLRPGVKFHDGSPLDAAAVVEMLPSALRSFMGSLSSGIEYVRAAGNDAVEIGFQEPAPFLRESLEVPIQKPGPRVVGTGPFMSDPHSQTDLLANPDYYLGQSLVGRIRLESYPSLRAAWAELLRGRLDMLYDVGPDSFSSLEGASNVAVFTFARRYQYVIALNNEAPVLQRRETRRALNMAIDRAAIVRNALSGQGIASSGLIWPRHWAFSPEVATFQFDPKQAGKLAGPVQGESKKAGTIRFTCLVPAGAEFERIALETKRQLGAVGVDMFAEEVSQEQLMQRLASRQFDAALLDVVGGPTLLRPYLLWHSKMPLNPGGLGNPTIDAALDRVQRAPSENEYRHAVAALQRAFLDDPPAIFLAWSVRARAVSRRFLVPSTEPGRDVVNTLRLWKPVTDTAQLNRN